jgi:polysaccharide pyruvyl transferase CsaB
MSDIMPFKVGIAGSYGGLNMGDEAILEGILQELRRSVPVEFTIFSRDPADTTARHDVDRALPVRDLSRDEVRPEIERLDLLIIGGGGILFDTEAELYLREAHLAHELGVPVAIYAVSAGPLEAAEARASVREALDRAAIVSVRDRQSRHLLEQIGLRREIVVTADPALLLSPRPLEPGTLEREGLVGDRPLIGVSVRERGPAAPDIDEASYHQLLADAADFMVYRYDADLVFVPMERRVFDVQQSHAVLAKMARADQATVLKGEYGPGELLAIIDRLDFAIGMRLHFLMFAAVQHVPFVALPYSGKVTGFLEDLDMQMPAVQVVSTGQMMARIDRSWDRRRELREHLARQVPVLQERARLTNQLIVDVLQRGRPAPETQSEAAG